MSAHEERDFLGHQRPQLVEYGENSDVSCRPLPFVGNRDCQSKRQWAAGSGLTEFDIPNKDEKHSNA